MAIRFPPEVTRRVEELITQVVAARVEFAQLAGVAVLASVTPLTPVRGMTAMTAAVEEFERECLRRQLEVMQKATRQAA